MHIQLRMCIFNNCYFTNSDSSVPEPEVQKKNLPLNNVLTKERKKKTYAGKREEITDAGKLLEYYINDTREGFEYLLYKNYDTKKLLNENLYCDINFAKFWTVFEKIPKSEEKVIKKQNIEKEVYKFIIDNF